MRRAARQDANQGPIIAALRAAGCAVYVLQQPVDLLVWAPGSGYYLIEIKNPDGFNRLTVAQKTFREKWSGPWYLVRTIEEALQCVGKTS